MHERTTHDHKTLGLNGMPSTSLAGKVLIG